MFHAEFIVYITVISRTLYSYYLLFGANPPQYIITGTIRNLLERFVTSTVRYLKKTVIALNRCGNVHCYFYLPNKQFSSTYSFSTRLAQHRENKQHAACVSSVGKRKKMAKPTTNDVTTLGKLIGPMSSWRFFLWALLLPVGKLLLYKVRL